jgi:hypothetical protein
MNSKTEQNTPKNIRFARVDVESVVSAGHLSISGITKGMRSIMLAIDW